MSPPRPPFWRRILFSKVALAGLSLKVLSSLWLWFGLFQPHQDFLGDELSVRIDPGSTVRQILGRLDREGVLANALLARAYHRLVLGAPPLKAGTYTFAGPMNAPQVLSKLVAGEIDQRSVTVVEGLSHWEVADHLAREGFGEREALLAAMRAPGLIADLDPAATDLEGYLFPDTYQLAPGLPETEVVAAMVATFRTRWQETVAPLLGGPQTPSLREVVTLASIIEEEAKAAEERPVIAGVYRNRLRLGMGLYADPTVIYALRLAGRWDGDIRRADLALESPYNTYRIAGLPPGPIASPGLASLAAAAQPADVPYLYFVSRNDGTHVFAESLAEHNANVDRWQRRYFRERGADGPTSR